MTQRAEEWDAGTGEMLPARADGAGYWLPEPERPEQWYRDNAAVFHALEGWQRGWDDFAREYEHEHGRPPSSVSRDRNKAAFRRMLCDQYGRGEPDAAWSDLRDAHLQKRGQLPERDGGRR
jgi:hypothetical protein